MYCNTVYIYILLRLWGPHTDKMVQNIQTVSMEIKDETNEISEAAIQYNTQSLLVTTYIIEISVSTMKLIIRSCFAVIAFFNRKS